MHTHTLLTLGLRHHNELMQRAGLLVDAPALPALESSAGAGALFFAAVVCFIFGAVSIATALAYEEFRRVIWGVMIWALAVAAFTFALMMQQPIDERNSAAKEQYLSELSSWAEEQYGVETGVEDFSWRDGLTRPVEWQDGDVVGGEVVIGDQIHVVIVKQVGDLTLLIDDETRESLPTIK